MFVSEMFDQLRDLLNDSADSQVTFATKKLYLNRGINRLFPSLWRVASTTFATEISTTTNARDYVLATAVMDGVILSVEKETKVDSNEFVRFDDYDIIPGDEDLAGVFRLTGIYPGDNIDIRIKYAARIPLISAATYVAAQAESWVGSDAAIGLPVLYAMGMVSARKLDDRQDTLRYSTTQALNGVTDEGIISAAQTWFGQFEFELLALERPLPPARD